MDNLLKKICDDKKKEIIENKKTINKYYELFRIRQGKDSFNCR